MPEKSSLDPERQRIQQTGDAHTPWRRWGPYLAERQWGTVREDYSPDGKAWESFPHDQARSRAYRWGEDGLLGFCDEHGELCFALSLWNGADPILKERLFGLTGDEGNHGEDVKEHYLYLDNTPTHSYMKALYRYPQRAFPYTQLREENRARDRHSPEYEIFDTGIFDDGRFWDVTVEYAKVDPDDIVVRIRATNQGPETATLDLLPTVWFRNRWSWGYPVARPHIHADEAGPAPCLALHHERLGDYWLAYLGQPELLFTGNETNFERLWGVPNHAPFVKDGVNDAVVRGAKTTNPALTGTKAALRYHLSVPSRGAAEILLRFADRHHAAPFADAAAMLEQRRAEADAFYEQLAPAALTADERLVQRRAFAGLLWSKKFYDYDVSIWLRGDPAGPAPPPERRKGRNAGWEHLNNADVILMPDSWEYPWYAAWDLAFHCVTVALVDPAYAKEQLLLLLRVWYQHPNGQLPAYEWQLSDVNPPVQAWAALRVYQIERRITGHRDRAFLERVFQKLLLNFTWWVNRKDSEGNNVFSGGFLGLDNIGIFDRSKPLPGGRQLEQADGTAWMGMYCMNMLAIALELASEDSVYEDVATKFFEHYLYIAGALNNIGNSGIPLWDDEDEFFYDVIHMPDGSSQPLRVRSLVGLIPLFAVETIEPRVLDRLPDFKRRMDWFLENRPALAGLVAGWEVAGHRERRLLALVQEHRMRALLRRALDPAEFLSDYGLRSLSRHHLDHPYTSTIDGAAHSVDYEPGESTTGLFGGNSNWRGPVWFPLNYLLIEALQRFHWYYGDDYLVECPTGSGRLRNLWQVSQDLSRRLTSLFLRDDGGRRAAMGPDERWRSPEWADHILFFEYFHGETGQGLGASHQTGWTALVAKLLEQQARFGDRSALD